jgi:hypothetical protein
MKKKRKEKKKGRLEDDKGSRVILEKVKRKKREKKRGKWNRRLGWWKDGRKEGEGGAE